jgi:hypothetical protein
MPGPPSLSIFSGGGGGGAGRGAGRTTSGGGVGAAFGTGGGGGGGGGVSTGGGGGGAATGAGGGAGRGRGRGGGGGGRLQAGHRSLATEDRHALSVDGPVGGPQFDGMRAAFHEHGLGEWRASEVVSVDADVGPGGNEHVDPPELRARLCSAVVGVGALFVGDLSALGEKLLEVPLRFERMTALETAPPQVEQHGWVLLERIHL